MNITDPQDLADMFSIFHDGTIEAWTLSDGVLSLVVDIPYLANRVHSSYEQFTIQLVNVDSLTFKTWPTAEVKPEFLADAARIFLFPLWILEGQVDNSQIVVYCSLPKIEDPGYSGGELRFYADGANVTTQGGELISLDQLKTHAENYWEEWSQQ